ncbi:hypothetical protein ACROYT_G044488 [Oculina patagonica]
MLESCKIQGSVPELCCSVHVLEQSVDGVQIPLLEIYLPLRNKELSEIRFSGGNKLLQKKETETIIIH